LKNNIGIVQGRLSKAPKGRLQFFPKKWEKEFFLAKKAKLQFIEFFSERRFNKENPIWNDEKIKLYKKFAKKHNLKIINFCDDYIIQNSILNKKNQKYFNRLILQCSKLKVKNIILPMYSSSDLNDENSQIYTKVLKKISLEAKKQKMNILIESNISPMSFSKLVKKIKSKNIYFLFDTGNRAIINRNLEKDIIEFGKFLKHVHIKDKNNLKKNVPLGKGLVNFKNVFISLKKIKFKGNFTIESIRGNNPVFTARKNVLKIKSLINNVLTR